APRRNRDPGRGSRRSIDRRSPERSLTASSPRCIAPGCARTHAPRDFACAGRGTDERMTCRRKARRARRTASSCALTPLLSLAKAMARSIRTRRGRNWMTTAGLNIVRLLSCGRCVALPRKEQVTCRVAVFAETLKIAPMSDSTRAKTTRSEETTGRSSGETTRLPPELLQERFGKALTRLDEIRPRVLREGVEPLLDVGHGEAVGAEAPSELRPSHRSRHRSTRASARRIGRDGGSAPGVPQVIDEDLARALGLGEGSGVLA